MEDWGALKQEYVEGTMSYRELARLRETPYDALRKRAAAEGWARARRARRTRDKLEGLRQAADLAAQRIGEMLADEQQFHRHLVRYGRDGEYGVEERILDKVDTRALKDAVSAIRSMTVVMRDLHGLLSEQEMARLGGCREGETGGVIQLPLPGEEEGRHG
ncbi:MAG TPA: hypothetical protein IAA74_09575 [Candidatus Excrementavichristensenella intestinipullorum]|nr:hypothetical protein [Candidatus Excrementavichristensenella intestinipullorum]